MVFGIAGSDFTDLGSVHYLWLEGRWWFGKIDRRTKKRAPLPSRIHRKKIAPSMTLQEIFASPFHVLKTCLYVAVVLLQQLEYM